MDSISSDARRFENEFALLLEERGELQLIRIRSTDIGSSM